MSKNMYSDDHGRRPFSKKKTKKKEERFPYELFPWLTGKKKSRVNYNEVDGEEAGKKVELAIQELAAEQEIKKTGSAKKTSLDRVFGNQAAAETEDKSKENQIKEATSKEKIITKQTELQNKEISVIADEISISEVSKKLTAEKEELKTRAGEALKDTEEKIFAEQTSLAVSTLKPWGKERKEKSVPEGNRETEGSTTYTGSFDKVFGNGEEDSEIEYDPDMPVDAIWRQADEKDLKDSVFGRGRNRPTKEKQEKPDNRKEADKRRSHSAKGNRSYEDKDAAAGEEESEKDGAATGFTKVFGKDKKRDKNEKTTKGKTGRKENYEKKEDKATKEKDGNTGFLKVIGSGVKEGKTYLKRKKRFVKSIAGDTDDEGGSDMAMKASREFFADTVQMIKAMINQIQAAIVAIITAIFGPLVGMIVSVFGPLLMLIIVILIVIIVVIIIAIIMLLIAVFGWFIAVASAVIGLFEQSSDMYQYAYEKAKDFTNIVYEYSESYSFMELRYNDDLYYTLYSLPIKFEDSYLLYLSMYEEATYDENFVIDVIYDNEAHMLSVLDVIINKSYHKLGFNNGKGQTYEALLTTSSIQLAQKYYELLTRVKNGETPLVIDEKIKQVLPDFPKFAITYSISENEEGSQVNQQKMQGSLDDYNKMFGTKYDVSQIQGYNANLNKRLARKDAKYKSRSEQLDLVIVVDRLLTGFDAPCLSTIFIDRQPMGPHDLIQAFSRTNRIFDKNKAYGQIVTFQAPKLFKESVDNAIKLYSAGGTKEALLADWEEIEPAFKKSLAALRVCAASPSEIPGMSTKEKESFVKIFQNFDALFAQLKSFTCYDEEKLPEYGITEEEYIDYVGHYLNVLEELKKPKDPPGDEPEGPEVVDYDYELMAYSNTKIDYEYIINLIQNIVTPSDDSGEVDPEERQKKIDEVRQYVEELRKENPKVAELMSTLIDEIEIDEEKYKGQSIMNIVETMKQDCIDRVITDFCLIWYASKDDVMYAATHYRNGEIPNESAIKATIDFTSYKQATENALPKFKYYAKMMTELKIMLDDEIKPLINH